MVLTYENRLKKGVIYTIEVTFDRENCNPISVDVAN